MKSAMHVRRHGLFGTQGPSLQHTAGRMIGRWCLWVAPSYCQVRLDQICDLLQLPCKPVQTRFMIRLLVTKQSPPPGFLVKCVWKWTPSRIKKPPNLSTGGGAPCEAMAIHIWCQPVSADVVLQLGTSFEEVGGRICTPTTVKHFIPQNTSKNAKKTENPVRGSTS